MDENCKRSKGPAKTGNKSQHKPKVKRPGSPYHISALTVYQDKDAGKGLTVSGREAAQRAAGGSDSEVSSSDLRAKWFLSTSQWQGCIPLQISDSASIEEALGAGEHLASSNDAAESNEMSPAVSESLEKMKENHSLFYKIACDISISDTDVEKNDGNSNSRTSLGSEEEEEDKEVMADAECALKEVKEAQNTTQLSTQEEAADVSKKKSKPLDETSEDQSERDKDLPESPTQSHDCDSVVDEDKATRGKGDVAKEWTDRKVDQKRSRDLRKCSSEENMDAVGERDEFNVPSYSRDRRATRSASFGKARLTVLRTSL